MGLSGPQRPRLSRETRLLLATILLSIAALWALARVRFPNRPVATSPVPPLLTQLTPPPAFDDLAAEISKLESRLLPSFVKAGSAAALRVRRGAAAVYIPPDDLHTGSTVPAQIISRDEASGLGIVSVPDAAVGPLPPWNPIQLDRSRYAISTAASAGGVFLRPVFIGHLQAVSDPAWQTQIWIFPQRTDLSPGDFLLTTDGALIGLVVARERALAVVPAETLLAMVDTLLQQPASPRSWVGVQVDALPEAIAASESSGVVVAWVDPKGPAAEKLMVMDVIEALEDNVVASPTEWRVRMARLAPGASIVLRVRRASEVRQVSLVTAASPPFDAALGLTMRTVRRVGADVSEVSPGSAAARAGIREGDVITAVGNIRAPTAQQVETAFAAAPANRPLLVAIARGNRHHVVALEKK
jgi:S1-C subfamily serine protease